MEDSWDKMRNIVRHREEVKQQYQEIYKEESKARLKKIIDTKIQTTMIGSLALIEQKFGNLWGHGKSRDQLSERERFFDQLKEELRREILDNGNNQRRAASNEIEQYEIVWQRHRRNFKMGNQ